LEHQERSDYDINHLFCEEGKDRCYRREIVREGFRVRYIFGSSNDVHDLKSWRERESQERLDRCWVLFFCRCINQGVRVP